MASRTRRLEAALAAIEHKHGAGTLRRAAEMARPLPPHVPSGFGALDALTGCGGIPLAAMTLLSGHTTSGKLTLAFKVLASAQQMYPKQTVALVDLHAATDPDYLARAGIDLERLLVVRPPLDTQAVDVLVDLAASRKVRVLVANSLTDYKQDRRVYRHLVAHLGRLYTTLHTTRSALLWIDDPSAPWLRWFNLDEGSRVRQYAALHVELQFEQWLTKPNGELRGYQAHARLLKSRWARAGRSAALEIVFNGTIRAGPTW